MPIEIICKVCLSEKKDVKFDNWKPYALHLCASHPQNSRFIWAMNNLLISSDIIDEEEVKLYKELSSKPAGELTDFDKSLLKELNETLKEERAKGKMLQFEIDEAVRALQEAEALNDDELLPDDDDDTKPTRTRIAR